MPSNNFKPNDPQNGARYNTRTGVSPRDHSRDHECSGEIASLSNSERNLAIFTLPAFRVRVAHDDVTTLAPYDLGLEAPSMMLLQRRIEEDAPQQRCVRE